ncbi:hypothetical protein D3C76_479110 [compost metagenome]
MLATNSKEVRTKYVQQQDIGEDWATVKWSPLDDEINKALDELDGATVLEIKMIVVKEYEMGPNRLGALITYMPSMFMIGKKG